MPEKLSRTEIVRKSYSMAASLLAASVTNGNIEEMCMVDEGLSEHDGQRVARHVEKIADRLRWQASSLGGSR